MRDRPTGVTEPDVVRALAVGWGIDVTALRYAAVGGGSYHWVVDDDQGECRFVTVDDLDVKGWLGRTRPAVLAGLAAAMDAAAALCREAALRFVVAPVPALDGRSVQPDDISCFVRQLRSPHRRTPGAEHAWQALEFTIEQLTR